MNEAGMLVPVLAGDVARRAMRYDRGVGIVAGILHRERRENIFTDELFVGLAGDLLDEVTEQYESGIAVLELLAGLEIERLVAEAGDELFRRCGERLQLSVVRETGEVRNAGTVGQQIEDRDLAPGGRPVREVLLDRIVDAQLPALFQQEDRGRGELLGNGGDVVKRPGMGKDLPRPLQVTKRFGECTWLGSRASAFFSVRSAAGISPSSYE